MNLIEELEVLVMYLRTTGADAEYRAQYVQDKLEVLLAKHRGEKECSQEQKKSSSAS